MKRSVVVFVNGDNINDLVPVKKSDVKRALSYFSNGTKCVLTLRSYYRTKTLSQLNVFFAYVAFLQKHTGHSRNEIKNAVLENYGLWTAKLDKNGDVVFDKKGNAIFKPKGLEDYNTKELSELLERFHGGMFDDFGIVVPDPETYSKINLEI